MSKLYLQGGSDARRTPITARGHRAIHATFLYNWKGGNVAEGGVECAMFHRGDKVVFEYGIKGTDPSSRFHHFIIFHPDGTYETGKY